MRILFCTYQKESYYLGYSRIILDLINEANKISTNYFEIADPSKIGCSFDAVTELKEYDEYSSNLLEYIKKREDEFDVIEYDHEFLPFDRSNFSYDTLYVTRSVLLAFYLESISYPQKYTFRRILSLLFKRKKANALLDKRIKNATETCLNADLINVANHIDKKELIKIGVDSDKIIVIPYGMNEQRMKLFDITTFEIPKIPEVVFVGTFDYRKGAVYFNKIFKLIAKKMPNIKFKIIGCKGRFTTEKEIRKFFSASINQKLDIVMTYDRNDIAKLLKNGSVGIFPSYFESFGLGVLEMMMANIPVIAFDSPGPNSIVDDLWIVNQGDFKGMAQKVIDLLVNDLELVNARKQARKLAEKFKSEIFAQETIEEYSKRIKVLRLE